MSLMRAGREINDLSQSGRKSRHYSGITVPCRGQHARVKSCRQLAVASSVPRTASVTRVARTYQRGGGRSSMAPVSAPCSLGRGHRWRSPLLRKEGAEVGKLVGARAGAATPRKQGGGQGMSGVEGRGESGKAAKRGPPPPGRGFFAGRGLPPTRPPVMPSLLVWGHE